MIEPVDPDYTQGDGQFCPHSPLHSLHNNSLLSRREEGRKEGEGRKLRWKKSNCWSKCEVKCSGSAKREGAVSYSERCGFSVGSFLSLFFFFLSIIDEKNPHLDQYYQISFSGALSLALKSIFFFSKSCHVWDYACDGLSHHPPLAHTLLPLRLCRSDTEAGRKVTKVALPFICLCIWHCHREHLILLFTGPAAACWTDGLEEWHRLCLKGRPWSTCSSGTAGLTGSGDLLSVRAERKRSFSRSGPSGLTGTFYTCIAVTLISGGCLGDWWSLFRRTDEICPNLHW